MSESVCCLLVLNLVSPTLPCIRQPGPRLRVLGVVLVLVLRDCAVTVSSTEAENQFQADDNGHVGRPCEVSLAPPYQEPL